MTRNTKLMIAVVAVLTLLVPVAAAMAQATKVTEEATLEVIKVIGKQAGSPGHTVIIQNLNTKEFHKYSAIPDNVVLMVNGKPAKISDLKKGMKFQALRMENVQETKITQAEVEALPASDPAPAPAPAPEPAAAPTPAAALAPAPAPAAAPATLPHTASNLPLVGLGGLAFLLAGAVVAGLRRRTN